MIPFKINGIRHQFPTCWQDVTYNQYIQLLQLPNSLLHYIHLFSGIPVETLQRSEFRNLEKIAIALAFLSMPPKYEGKPTPMVGPFVTPKDVTIESLAQFEDLRGLIQRLPRKDIKEYEAQDHVAVSELYLEACAIYVQKIKDGKYDHTKVAAVKETLRNYSCIEIIQTGSFFFYRPLNISMPTMSRYQRAIQLMRKFSQELPGYQSTLDFLQRSSKPQKQ